MRVMMKSMAGNSDAGASAPSMRSIAARWPAALAGGRSVLGAALLGAAIVIAAGVPLCAIYNIWIDESFTLHSTAHGPLFAYAAARDFELQPPFYFVLESIWRLLDPGSVAFARLPSVAFAALAVALIVLFASRIAPHVPPLAVALALALNPFVLWAASELRLYALMLALGAGLSWAFTAGFIAERPSRRAAIAFTLIAIAALYTQYYFAIVFVVLGAVVLIVRPSSLLSYIAAMAAVGAAFAPFVPTVLVHFSARGEYVERLGILGVGKQVFDALFVFVLPHELWWSTPVKLAGTALAGALAAALVFIGRPRFGRAGRSALWAIGLLFAVFCAAFVVTGLPVSPTRHLAAIFAPTLLAALVLLSSLTRRQGELRAAAAVLVAVFTAGTLGVTFRPPLVKVGDWRTVAATLAHDDRDGTPIAVFPNYLTLILKRYLPTTPVLPIPGPISFTVDYDARAKLRDVAEVARELDPIRAQHFDLWLVTTSTCSTQAPTGPVTFDYHCMYLAQYLAEHYREVQSRDFYGSRIVLYRRTSVR